MTKMVATRRSSLRGAAAAAVILLLMLSSPFVGIAYAQTAPLQALPPAPALPPDVTPPHQTSPGLLSYTNTWNRTQALTCPPAVNPAKSPLVKQTSPSVTLTSTVPTILAGGSAAPGQSVTYSYTAYSNGTFLASDGQGNQLSWQGVTGFPAGPTAITLYGNSTEAVQFYTVGSAGQPPTANFTVSYALRQATACRAGGVKVTIEGSINDWPTQAGGKLRIVFHGQQLSANLTGVAFGGHGGMELVFDWSDTMGTTPTAYQGLTGTVSWTVGKTFRIDPSIIGTSSSQQAINWGDQRKLWHTQETNGTTEYWAFYVDGPQVEVAWSLNGIGWRSSSLAFWSYGAAIPSGAFSTWVYGSGGVYTMYYVLATPSGFVLGTAQLGDNGAVKGLAQTTFSTVWGGDAYPCVYGAPSQVLVGIGTAQAGSYHMEIDSINPSAEKVVITTIEPTGSLQDGCIALGLTSGYAIVYGPATTSGPVMVLTSPSGAFASSSPNPAPTTSPITMSSAVAVGNELAFATPTVSGEGFWSCTYPCATIGAVQTLAADPSSGVYDNPVLSTDARSGGSSLTVTYHGPSQVLSRTSADGGKTWTAPQPIDDQNTTGSIVSGSLQADYDYVVSETGVGTAATTDLAWITGMSAPYTIWFPAFPVVVPSASTTSDPWAQSGYSPYESYFTQLGEYVSPGNGLLGVSQTDISIPGRSPALSIAQVYSQPSDFFGTVDPKAPYGYDNYTLSNLGIGWELAFPWLGGTAADPTFLHPGDGAAIPILFNSSNIMEYHGSTNFVLYHNVNNGTYTLYTADGTKYEYEGLKLTVIASPDSPSDFLSFNYGPQGYIDQITDPEGRSVTLSYNSNETLASISSAGATWKFTYKGSDLASVTDPLGRVTRYYYASFNPWLISEIAYPTGAATFYTYDVGPVAPEASTYAVQEQYEYSSLSAGTLVRTNSYAFDMVDGSMVSAQIQYIDGAGEVQGSTAFDFSQTGSEFVQLEVQKGQSGNILGEVRVTFDQHGWANSTSILSPQGAVLAYSVTHYDDWGNVNFTRDYDGHDAYYAYANTQDEYKFGNGETGLPQNFYANSTIDRHIHADLLGAGEFQDALNSANPIVTFYLYDNGEVMRATQLYIPTGRDMTWLTTSYAYDPLGNLISVTDPLGDQTCYAYSSAYGSAYVTSETDGGTAGCYNPPDVETAYTYNFATGALASETDGEGNTTTYTYDVLGRLTSETDPAVNGVGATTRYSYDDATNVVTVTDPAGNITKDYYDGLVRLTEVQAYLSPTAPPYSAEYYTYNWQGQEATDQAPSGAVTAYSYDSLGRQVLVTNPDGSTVTTSYNDTTNTETVTDANGAKTQYVYDFMQNLLAVREYWSATTYNSTSYTYDGVGNMVEESGPNTGQVTQYAYDDLNRLVATLYPDGTTQRQTYDAAGDLLSSKDQMGRVTTYSYDFLGQLTAVHYADGSSTAYTYAKDGDELTVTNAVDQVRYSYDALGDLLSETDTINGTQYRLSYAYDLAGNLRSTTYPDGTVVRDSYDALGRMTKVAGAATTYASFTYNPDGTVGSTTYGNGQVTKYGYDSMDRPTSITTSEGSTQQLGLNYKYDAAGDVVSIGSESYGYDALDRLTSATGPWGTTTYSYDAAGNMVEEKNSTSTTKSIYNSMDEVGRSVTTTTGGTTTALTTYTYDDDGDLVIKNDDGNIWVYQYDTQGQLVKVYDDAQLVQKNLYDGAGRRVEQVTKAGVTLYMYAGLDVVYEKNLQTGVTTDHVYANGMQVASVTTAATLFLHQDGIGSTRLVSGSGGASVFSSDYMPYGVQYGATGSTESMYAGMLYDAATGLYYDYARFYDPATGGFLSADPSGGDPSDPQSLNGYAYARDDPLAITDPSGLSWWNPFSWTTTQAALFGAVLGLVGLSVVQLGLDPVSDFAAAGALGELVSSFSVENVGLVASMVGLPVVTESVEDDGMGVNEFIGTLARDQFDEFFRDEPDKAYRTDIGEARLAYRIGADTTRVRVYGFVTEEQFMHGQEEAWRYFDLHKGSGLWGEFKLGSKVLNLNQILLDVELSNEGYNIHVFMVEDPVTGAGPTPAELDTYGYLRIPYTYLTWEQFLDWDWNQFGD